METAAVSAALTLLSLSLVLTHLGYFPGLDASGFFSGRQSAASFRRAGLFGYGDILPAFRREAGTFRGESAVLVGERLMWDIPARVIGMEFEPAFIWSAVAESPDAGRVAVRFRQARVRWILFNPEKSRWDMQYCTPYPWDSGMARRYLEFARRHIRLSAWSGKDYPQYGSNWLFRVSDVPLPPEKQVLFLPGAEHLFCKPEVDRQRGILRYALDGYARLSRALPGLLEIDAMLGEVMFHLGMDATVLPLLRNTMDSGLVFNGNLLYLAITLARTGRKAEAERVLERAAEVYAVAPERITSTRALAGLPGKKPVR